MKHREGFTLLEVLIALTILAVGIMAVMQLFPVSLTSARQAIEDTVSAELADSQLGKVRASGADRLMRGLSSIQTVSAGYSVYSNYQSSVQRMRGAGGVGLQRVVFRVEMPDGREQAFVTYVANQ
jgi:prepilin-type N-terminal cleavage/methylation domain-containing protein